MKKSMQLLVVGLSVLSLAACSTTGKNAGVTEGANGFGNGSANGAVTSGLGSDSGFDSNSNGQNAGHLQVGNQTYYFDFDKSDVRSDDLPSLKVQANYLATHSSAKVVLEGNTDPRGSREYNIGLGQRRADSVVSVLKMQGVAESQIRTVSYGSEKLAAEGHDDAAYALDRRVNLVYEGK